jgi:hypothetical protein
MQTCIHSYAHYAVLTLQICSRYCDYVSYTSDSTAAAAAATVATSVSTSAVGASLAANTATTVTAATATAAGGAAAATTATAATATAAHDEHRGSSVVDSNLLESSSNIGYSIRERSDSVSSDMSLDVVEEMLDAAAVTNNGESHMHACRHCVYSICLYSTV